MLIPVAIPTEAATAYVAMEALIDGQPLAMVLALLAALIGAAAACILTNRRFNRLPALAAARIPKARMTLAAIAAAAVAMVATGFLLTHPAGGAPPPNSSVSHIAVVVPPPAVVPFKPDTEVFADPGAASVTLTRIAYWLAANPPGHASLDGMSDDIELSRQRAEAIRKELIAMGAKPAQITIGVGQSTSAAEVNSVRITLGCSAFSGQKNLC